MSWWIWIILNGMTSYSVKAWEPRERAFYQSWMGVIISYYCWVFFFLFNIVYKTNWMGHEISWHLNICGNRFPSKSEKSKNCCKNNSSWFYTELPAQTISKKQLCAVTVCSVLDSCSHCEVVRFGAIVPVHHWSLNSSRCCTEHTHTLKLIQYCI